MTRPDSISSNNQNVEYKKPLEKPDPNKFKQVNTQHLSEEIQNQLKSKPHGEHMMVLPKFNLAKVEQFKLDQAKIAKELDKALENGVITEEQYKLLKEQMGLVDNSYTIKNK